MQHVISVVVGDWSCDGHNQFRTFLFRSNLSSEEIQTALRLGIEKIGVDISTIANGYEVNTISQEDVAKFVAHGLDADAVGDRVWDDGEQTDERYLDVDSFLDLWLFTINVGNPAFESELIVAPAKNNFNIGGYGLFS